MGLPARRGGRRWRPGCAINPARSSAFRCLETTSRVIRLGELLTDVSPYRERRCQDGSAASDRRGREVALSASGH